MPFAGKNNVSAAATLAEITSSVLGLSKRSIKHPFVRLIHFLVSTQLREML